MNSQPTLCTVAIAVSAAISLSGCGGDSDNSASNTTSTSYIHHNQQTCADTNFDGQCSQYEQQVLLGNGYPKMLNISGATLTAPAEIDIVSPFTTLIHSEMLYNPKVQGQVNNAKAYLQAKLGNHVGVYFKTLDINYGPSHQSQILMQSLIQAQQSGLRGASPMVKIAHALDVMIKYQTLDLSSINLDKESSQQLLVDGAVLVHGSQADNSLKSLKSIALNPANNTLLYLDGQDTVKQLSTSVRTASGLTTNQQATLELTKSHRLAPRTNMRSEDHHESDHHGNDDDFGGNANNLPYFDKDTSRVIKQVLPALNSVQSYKLYNPENHAIQVDNCEVSGGNGIFLTSLKDNTSHGTSADSPNVITIQPIVQIDTTGGASGSELPTLPPTPVVIEPSSASCYNDNFEWMKPLYLQNSLLARWDNGLETAKDQLWLLDNKSLNRLSWLGDVKTSDKQVIVSKNEQSILLIPDIESQTAGTLEAKLIPLNNRTFGTPSTIKLQKDDSYPIITTASFAANQRIVFALQDENKTKYTIIWVNKGAPSQPLSSIPGHGVIKYLESSPDGKFTVAVTAKNIYLLNNQTQQISRTIDFDSAGITNLFVQNDKAIAVGNGKIDYFQFANLSGPKLLVATHLITEELVKEWGKAQEGSTTLYQMLSQTPQYTTLEAHQTISPFESINLDWNILQGDVKSVDISGTYRGEKITITKPL
ncbi:hypothetical protein [Vibrio pectenicida]|uniref:Uncharacterized protein n=1 Tax=Vibrio pectenicida TaxID=62763 RepID=A0A3R9EKC5_9VIBR|nr:hypothetical protein [Vibrio pectenicida]RSD32443.1 hypothetical protein EJA03_03570 [Vibrio pectenicida]